MRRAAGFAAPHILYQLKRIGVGWPTSANLPMQNCSTRIFAEPAPCLTGGMTGTDARRRAQCHTRAACACESRWRGYRSSQESEVTTESTDPGGTWNERWGFTSLHPPYVSILQFLMSTALLNKGEYSGEKGKIRYLDGAVPWCYYECPSFTLSFPEESSPRYGRHRVSFPCVLSRSQKKSIN